MTIAISKLTSADITAVDGLMKRHSATIGFLPNVVLEDHLSNGCVLGAKTEDGQLIGYLLYSAYPDRFRIVQLCISEEFRGRGIAKELIETLKTSATSQKVIRLSCRNDFPAHSMWPKLGFVPVSERHGRSREGHLLTAWRLIIAHDDQLALFRANISDEILDIIIDAQVFFDFDEPDADNTLPSKALISDSFIDSVNICFTDELLTEISRNHDADRRRNARARAGQFVELQHDPLLVNGLIESLAQILPSSTESQVSDIKHLAKAASSDVSIFVTRDQALLKKADQIAELTHLQVLSPTEVIMRLRELSEEQAYTPDRVAGLGLGWRRLESNELAAFPFTRFLDQQERLNQLKERVESFLVNALHHEVEVLYEGNDPVVLRVLAYTSPKALTVLLGRVATSRDRSLWGRFLISDVVYKALRMNRDLVRIESTALPSGLLQGLSEMGFTRSRDGFVRFCLAEYRDREGMLSEAADQCPECVDNFRNMTELELEHSFSPLMSSADRNCFVIPIRPGYALNLFDRVQSAYDLFGGNPNVLLLWSNVYYRAATLRRMLRGPGRILWYVSGGPREIVAVSHLDEVVVDTPKELFRRFKRYGTLEWRDLYRMCGGDISRQLMALRFSHTFPFRTRISLEKIWAAFDEDGVGRSLQSPRVIPLQTFRRLFELGYPEES